MEINEFAMAIDFTVLVVVVGGGGVGTGTYLETLSEACM